MPEKAWMSKRIGFERKVGTAAVVQKLLLHLLIASPLVEYSSGAAKHNLKA